MHSITVFNKKGGVGKTTINILISEYLLAKGNSVLFIDLDEQSNSTGYYEKKFSIKCPLEMRVSYVLKDGSFKDKIFLMDDNFALVGSSKIQEIEDILAGKRFKELTLKRAVDNSAYKISDVFDFCVIDMPPTLTNLTINGLLLTDSFYFVTDPSTFGEDSIKDTITDMEEWQNDLDFDTQKVKGFIFNRINKSHKRDIEHFNKNPNIKSLKENFSTFTVATNQDFGHSQRIGNYKKVLNDALIDGFLNKIKGDWK